jgi:hypothetical protein
VSRFQDSKNKAATTAKAKSNLIDRNSFPSEHDIGGSFPLEPSNSQLLKPGHFGL